MIYGVSSLGGALVTTPSISGKTRLVPLVGYPAGHIRAPSFLNPALATRGIDAIVIPWQVAPGNLPTVIDAFRHSESMAGFIATVPHKTALPQLCDHLTDDAAALRAVNVVRRGEDGRLEGGILDGEGFVAGLKSQGHDLTDRNVLLIGAGGAASAIALALAREPIASLTIANRSRDKAQALAALVGDMTGKKASEGPADPRSYDIVVNATVLGMKDTDPLPVSDTGFRPGQLVAEAIMQPPKTRLLSEAEQAGAEIHLGEHMVRAQIGLLIDFLFNP